MEENPLTFYTILENRLFRWRCVDNSYNHLSVCVGDGWGNPSISMNVPRRFHLSAHQLISSPDFQNLTPETQLFVIKELI